MDDIKSVHQYLHDMLLARLNDSMSNYSYSGDDIIRIQLLVYKVEYTDNVMEKPKLDLSLNNIGKNKDLIDVSKTKIDLVFDKAITPTMDLDKYGKQLNVVMDNGNIKSVLFKDKLLDLSSLITKNNIKKYDIALTEDIKIFSYDDKFLIIIKSSSTKEHNIHVFTIEARHVLKLSDKALSDVMFIRTSGNVSKTVDTKSSTVVTLIKVLLDHIKLPKTIYSHRNLNIPNPKIGVLDIETYIDDGISRVYALGFYTKQYGAKTFYIDKKLNSNELVLRCIDYMLIALYIGMTFYVHNMGRYDIVLLLKILINANSVKEIYKLDIKTKDDLILSLGIKANGYNIKLIDSYNILSYSLKDLGKTYELNVKKDIFPYQFVNKNTIFYVGHIPEFSYYINYVDVDMDVYQTIYDTILSDGWSTEKETIKYLEKDLKSLFEVMAKFSDYIYRNYNVQVSVSLTISSLAIKIILRKFYTDNIPLINKKSLYDDIKKSYFGGITEVYKPYGEDLYYYDVNFLYPYTALNPMPGCNCVYEDFISSYLKDVANLFGFYYCSIKTLTMLNILTYLLFIIFIVLYFLVKLFESHDNTFDAQNTELENVS